LAIRHNYPAAATPIGSPATFAARLLYRYAAARIEHCKAESVDLLSATHVIWGAILLNDTKR